MAGYTPGEQPQGGAFIKLNTNENPFPPSPRVLEAIRAALTGDRLRRYPDPLGTAFRQTAGRVLGVDPDGILMGNGSDDLLTVLTRTFVPDMQFAKFTRSHRNRASSSKSMSSQIEGSGASNIAKIATSPPACSSASASAWA